MIKEIKINDNQTIKINTNIGWLFKYRSQFGHDILSDLLPIAESVMDMINIDDDNNVVANMENIGDALISIVGMESVTVINIVWALAANADPSIGTPEEWVSGLENFPLDVIVPECGSAILDSLVSTKNLKRLASLKNKMTNQPD